MIRLTDLTKRYGKFTAVDSINLEIRRGEVFGFLGPNGAGKTTTMRMIAGILQPTAGRIEIAGDDMTREPIRAKSRLGFIPDRPYVYDKLTGAVRWKTPSKWLRSPSNRATRAERGRASTSAGVPD